MDICKFRRDARESPAFKENISHGKTQEVIPQFVHRYAEKMNENIQSAWVICSRVAMAMAIENVTVVPHRRVF